jgi:hypothetical protein
LKQRQLRFGRKAKILIAIVVVAIVLVSFFAFLRGESIFSKWFPGEDQSSLIESSTAINSSVWRQVAVNAWAYFQPGVGVDPNTGLPYAGDVSFKAFTAWDLGSYIQAIIEAQKIGLISTEGDWGSNARLEKVVNFLENRPLNETTGYPFWFYDATTGKDYASMSDKSTFIVDVADTGRLLLALSNLIAYNSSWTQRIDNFVYNTYGNSSNFAALVPNIEAGAGSNSIYSYYIDSGFARFWPQELGNVPNTILNNIDNSPTITTYNVTLPDAPITCDPLLCSIYEANNTDSRLLNLMNQVYLAHEAYYNATNQYVAFSEGNSFTSNYIYEWIVAPNGSTWKITNAAQNIYYNINPIVYTKVAYSFLALYNTTYARNTVIFLEKNIPNPSKGYANGVDDSGNPLPGLGDNTNELILDAALYAMHNNSS